MTVVLALVLGALIGGVLGSLGGGGAILTVPALVYLLGMDARDATTASLIIVGLTAASGTAGRARAGRVRWGTGAVFGVFGAAAAFAGTAVNRLLDPDLLLLGFAALTAAAAIAMLIRSGPGDEPPRGGPSENDPSRAWARRPGATFAKVLLAGLAVGFLTGLFGVGGGFVVVPALVLALRLPMPEAVGTSLFVVAVNAAASLAARGGGHVDWALVLPFTLTAVTGGAAGRRVAEHLPAAVLTRAFAILLLAVAGYVAVSSVRALG